MRFLLVIAVYLACAGACLGACLGPAAAQTPGLTSAEALRVIEDSWNQLRSFVVLGDRTITKEGEPSCTSQTMVLRGFELLLATAKAGYVEIGYSPEFQEKIRGRNPSRQEMLDFAASGAIGRITVTATARADQPNTSVSNPGRNACLFFKAGSYTLKQVQVNEPLRKAGKDFRIVTTTHRVTYEPMMREILEAGGDRTNPDRKARVLLQHDPVRNRWLYATFDAADAAEEIKTTKIDDYLAALKE